MGYTLEQTCVLISDQSSQRLSYAMVQWDGGVDWSHSLEFLRSACKPALQVKLHELSLDKSKQNIYQAWLQWSWADAGGSLQAILPTILLLWQWC